MTIVITCFRDAIHVDKFGHRYRAKTTCINQADTICREILSHERNAGKQEYLSRENQVEVIVKLP